MSELVWVILVGVLALNALLAFMLVSPRGYAARQYEKGVREGAQKVFERIQYSNYWHQTPCDCQKAALSCAKQVEHDHGTP